jgi:hypothetical protein
VYVHRRSRVRIGRIHGQTFCIMQSLLEITPAGFHARLVRTSFSPGGLIRERLSPCRVGLPLLRGIICLSMVPMMSDHQKNGSCRRIRTVFRRYKDHTSRRGPDPKKIVRSGLQRKGSFPGIMRSKVPDSAISLQLPVMGTGLVIPLLSHCHGA